MPTFTFFELHTPDLDRARRFYGELFGWKFEEMPVPGPRFMLSRGNGHEGGLVEDTKPAWLNYLTVPDCQKAAEKARALGGRIVSERVTVPNAGSYVVVADPDGTQLALWQEERK